jgi:hypothetical protein
MMNVHPRIIKMTPGKGKSRTFVGLRDFKSNPSLLTDRPDYTYYPINIRQRSNRSIYRCLLFYSKKG